ncbi:MAG TPA: FAD-dependent oxidoreductase [Brevundimonas sp.]
MHNQIVIVGGGAGGLELAARLGRRLGPRDGPRQVLLIDRAVFHLWKPSLHEVAAGSLDSRQEGLDYLTLARRNHFRFVLGQVEGLDPDARRLRLAETYDADGRLLIAARSLDFERLVLATGAGSHLFDTPGAAEHACLLEDVADAEAFHRRLAALFLSSAYDGRHLLRIAIVGAGATGVELATELLEGHAVLSAALDPTERFTLEVTVAEAAPRILGGLPQTVADRAAQALQARGVRLVVGARVTRVRADGLETSVGDIAADLIVWAAGVKAAEINQGFGLATGRLNQFVVDDRLRASAPGVYAMGDCAEAPGPDGRPVPARAQAASQEAAYLARALTQAGDPGPYRYRDRGSLISLGPGHGLGSLMGGLAGPDFLIEGLIARWAYMALHLQHHRVVVGLPRTVLLALSRLLHRRVSGRLKLH